MTPRFSLLVAHDGSSQALGLTLESVRRQDHADWEILVVTPSPDERHHTNDDRIHWVSSVEPHRDEPADRAAALETARRAASGTWIGVLAAGDELEPGALGAVSIVLTAAPDADVVYTDEQWPAEGAEGIVAKPDYLPHHLQSADYLGRLCLMRATVLAEAGGFRAGAGEGAEWDAHLRVTELTGRVRHVPVVAVTRPAPPRRDDEATAAGLRAVAGRVERSGRQGTVEATGLPMTARVWWTPQNRPLVSLIVPTAGGRRTIHGEDRLLVEQCLASVMALTTYPEWEVVLVTSAHMPPEIVPALREIVGDRLRLAPVDGPFNFSYSVNEGARLARGEHLLLLNDDTEVIEPRWLERMVSVAADPAVGVVGAGLLFEDDTIQHVGIIPDDSLGPIHVLGSEDASAGHLPGKLLDIDYLAVTGACLLTPASVFAEVGGFCEDLPLNFNDVDYCLKVAASGRQVVCTPYARLHHYESSTRGHSLEPAEQEFLRRQWGLRLRHDPHVQYRSGL